MKFTVPHGHVEFVQTAILPTWQVTITLNDKSVDCGDINISGVPTQDIAQGIWAGYKFGLARGRALLRRQIKELFDGTMA